MKDTDIMTVKCDKCLIEFQITYQKYRGRIRRNSPMLCDKCQKEYISKMKHDQIKNMSSEKKVAFIEKQKQIYARKSEEEKKAHAQRTRDQLARRTPEEWAKINKKNSEGLKRHWKTLSEEERINRVAEMRKGNKVYYANMSAEERSQKARQWFESLSEEEKAKHYKISAEKMRQYNASLSKEEKQKRAQHMNDVIKNKSADKKKEIYTKSHQWYHNLSNYDKFLVALNKQQYYKNLSDDKKEEILSKIIHGKNSINSLTDKFISRISDLNLNYEFEYLTFWNNDAHSWDIAIFDNDHNLLALVDLDGEFSHADKSDYDGIHSNEYRDSYRRYTVKDDIKIYIIHESDFITGINYFKSTIFLPYNEFKINIKNKIQAMPFPYPSYSDIELMESYQQLLDMNPENKKYKKISNDNNIGERLIYHFHHSIFHDKIKNTEEIFSLLKSDKLDDLISDHVIIDFNKNKILQGFKTYEKNQAVSVFSAGRAKMIIDRYLADYDTIFDPFSGYSGRMLGAISLGKKYIGQDISERHVRESNQILDFLHKYGIKFDAHISQQDVLKSNGEYQCLFTCPPSDHEIYKDVPQYIKSYDEWIDICISNFKCNKYIFITSETQKYASYIIDAFYNLIHHEINYIVLITK